MILVAGVLTAVLVTAGWFPASALLHQRGAVSAAAAQVQALRLQDQALQTEQRRLSDPAEIQRLARQDYQLVSPGQQAFQVLNPNGVERDGAVLERPRPPAAGETLGGLRTAARLGRLDRRRHDHDEDSWSGPPRGQATCGEATPKASAPEGSSCRLASSLEFWR